MTQIAATLSTLRSGTRCMIRGIPVERLQDRYKVNRDPALITMEAAIQQVNRLMPKRSAVKREAIPITPLFPKEQRAMTTYFAWAYLMAKGYKAAEYRSQPTNLRGLVFLHSHGSIVADDIVKQFDIPTNLIARKRIVGAAVIVDCEQIEPGEYAYHLDRAVYFDQPTDELPGQQSIFWGALSPERYVQQRVRAFNQAWIKLDRMGKLDGMI